MNIRLSNSLLTILRLIVICLLTLGAAGTSVPAFASPPQYQIITPYNGTFVDNDQDTLDDAYEDYLMDRFAPLVKLSSCEDDYPASVDWYLDRVTLGWGSDKDSKHDQLGPVNTRANLISYAHGRTFSGAMNQRMLGQDAFSETDYYLEIEYNDPNTSTYRGQRTSDVLDTSTNPDTGKWPVYAHVRPSHPSHPGMIEISYWFFYPRNGNLGWTHCSEEAYGEHEGDWEHITVRVQADSRLIHGVYFAIHDGGHWKLPGDFTTMWTSIGRYGPVVWTAYHSHASYWDNGGDDEKHTADSFYPDWTDGHGVQWETWHHLYNVGEKFYPRPGMEWIQYTGKWGELDEDDVMHPDGPTGPALKGSWEYGDIHDLFNTPHPILEVTAPADQAATPNMASTFNLGSFTDSYYDGPWIMSVNWGDGTTSNFDVTEGQSIQYSHTYTAWGTFTVQTQVMNMYTAGSSSFTIHVWNTGGDVAQSGPTYWVNTTRDPTDDVCGSNHCTLAEAVQAANNDGVASTIELGAGQTYLVPASFNISGPLIINAHGAVLDAQLATRHFWVNPGASLEINDATLINGKIPWYGGAIYNQGNLVLRRCTFMYNTAFVGGALINDGTASIGDTTFWSNAAWYGSQYERGGAIFNRGTLTLLSSTLVNNIGALEDGGANLYNQATATVKNTIFQRFEMNSARNESCGGTPLASVSTNNLNTDDSCIGAAQGNANLWELDYYAGLTPHLPALIGPAIDQGNTIACKDPLIQGQDQRNYKRFADGNGDGYKFCDIGAHELNSQPGSSSAPAPDVTPPLTRILLTPATPDGANGWYIGPVTMKPEARDNDTGVIELRCALDPQTVPTTYADLPEDICPFLAGAPVSDDGPHSLYIAAMDEAGNQSAVLSKAFQIDATPPVFETCPAAGPFLLQSGDQTVGPASVDASVSGLDEAASTLSGIVATESVGPKPLTFTAIDLASNFASLDCSYEVIFDFGGFYPPVEPAPTFNPAEAGSAIPIKFSLAGDQGLDILAERFPIAQQVDPQTLEPIGESFATKPAGNSGLSYDPETGWYIYVWKTDKGWTGTWKLTIQLIDGTQHVAYFQFQ